MTEEPKVPPEMTAAELAAMAGGAVGSPGILSGNVVQIPIDIPINADGNTIDVRND